MARAPPLSLAYLASDSLFEQEVLKLTDGETEDDLNRRLIQSAEDVGMSEHEVSQCLGPNFVIPPIETTPSTSVSTAIHSPNSRGSFNTGSTAHTSDYSLRSDELRHSGQATPHRRNISISSLFRGKDTPDTSIDSMPYMLPEIREASSPRRTRGHFVIKDVEISILNGKGLKKFSRGLGVFRKGSGSEPVPWQREPSPGDLTKYSTGGIHASLAGRVDLKDPRAHIIVEKRMHSASRAGSRAPSINTEAGGDRPRVGLRALSGAYLRKKANRQSIGDPRELQQGKHSWSATDLPETDSSAYRLTPMSTMHDEDSDSDGELGGGTTLQAMLASSPYAEPEPVRQEMKDAMKARSFLMVQAANRNELRRLRAFRNKQVRALQTLHDNERNKMLSVFDQQRELIDAKYRQALIHLIEDRQVIAELDLLASLDERRKREQGKLRHMEAYCDPSSGRTVTAAQIAMLDAQRTLVAELQSDKFRQDSSNHLREKQDNDIARLPKQQELELTELDDKRQRALHAREEVETQETRALNSVVRRRREAAVSRANLRLEVWRRRFEGEALKPLPGPLPYLRSDDVFEAFWMVDVPIRSALDQILPEAPMVIEGMG